MWYRLVKKMHHERRLRQYLKIRRHGVFENADHALTCVLRVTRRTLSPATQNVTTGPPDQAAIFGLDVPLPRAQEHSSFMVWSSISLLQLQYLSSDLHVTYTTVIQKMSLKQPTNGIHVAQTLRVTMRHAASTCHCHKPTA